eukprot:m.114745 g.114745  ORF g.114745 m.114745 type:complete len:67 (+) comp14177_c1_seq5:2043-2243(+)
MHEIESFIVSYKNSNKELYHTTWYLLHKLVLTEIQHKSRVPPSNSQGKDLPFLSTFLATIQMGLSL